ncbi:MAG: HAMP domain-containing protein [Caldilineaceae bacterium]|nr:HAMP domain-containing protein [Caldilineaceae bacterium]
MKGLVTSFVTFLLTFYRRIEWLHLFSYVVIVAAEILVLREIRGTPEASLIRYTVFIGVVAGSLLLIRQLIIQPIQEMKRASLHIAAGHYHERLPEYRSIELNELAQAFNQMADTIAATEQRRVELIGDVAHELRTPLSNIRATMEGLVDEVLEPDEATFLSVQHEVSRLQRLVTQLEELSIAESGQIPLRKREVDLRQLVGEVGNRLKPQYDDKGVTLAYRFAPDLPKIDIDPDRITQVLVNLLGNALQYTPQGGEVAVQVTHEGPALTTRVIDQGAGIPPEELTRIFERFYRVDKSRARSSGGNGIGLTIARHLVGAHGGDIWAESKGIGKGATFVFTLPL